MAFEKLMRLAFHIRKVIGTKPIRPVITIHPRAATDELLGRLDYVKGESGTGFYIRGIAVAPLPTLDCERGIRVSLSGEDQRQVDRVNREIEKYLQANRERVIIQ